MVLKIHCDIIWFWNSQYIYGSENSQYIYGSENSQYIYGSENSQYIYGSEYPLWLLYRMMKIHCYGSKNQRMLFRFWVHCDTILWFWSQSAQF